MKVSKKVLVYIGIGVYVIATLASGYILFGKFNEHSKIDEELTLAEAKINQTNVDGLSDQIRDLEDQFAELSSKTDTYKEIMSQEYSNVYATRIVFEVAGENYVEVIDLNSLSSFSEKLEDIPCDVVPLEAIIEGNVEDIVSFVTQLNTALSTGVIKSVNLSIPESGTGIKPTAVISLLIYNYQDY